MVHAPSRRQRTSVRALVVATHAGPTVAVTTTAALLAVTAGVAPGRVALLALAVLAGQVSIGWSNDWLDADRDRAVARADKPVAQGTIEPGLLRALALGSAAAAVVLSLLLGLVPGLLLLVLVASGWAYNAGLKRTAFSVLPYLTGFGALPAGVVAAAPDGAGGSGWVAAPWWLSAAGAALGAAAHLANVAPDLEDDLATGVRGLPHRLGPRASAVTGAVLLGAASLALVLGPDGAPTAVGWAALALTVPSAVVVAVLAGTARLRRLAFPAVLLLTLLDVVLLLAGGAAVG